MNSLVRRAMLVFVLVSGLASANGLALRRANVPQSSDPSGLMTAEGGLVEGLDCHIAERIPLHRYRNTFTSGRET
jgi:hypothetical protein